MPIENNLPVILDTATQTEDGLLSYRDKIKLDELDVILANTVKVTDKIKSDQLDTSSDEAKIKLLNLSTEVVQAIAGTASVNAVVANGGVTTEKLASNAVTVDKIDKRVLLGNVVSAKPINFAFGSRMVTITVPKGSLLLTDATTSRNLVTGSTDGDVVVNVTYPTSFDGLNFLISTTTGSLALVNHRQVSTITNTSTIIALVSLTATYQAAVVMNGNYTINGLQQGVGTESAALLGTGKIVFEQSTGIVDFTEAGTLYLCIGGVYNRTITSQVSIRLADYAEDTIYCLYWDNDTSSLKAISTTAITDTNINKIGLIQNGRIIPFVNTGIFYSKLTGDSPYYIENFDSINSVGLISPTPLNILTKTVNKIQIPENTFVILNGNSIRVKNTECTYLNRNEIHFILFDLDNHVISCEHSSKELDPTVRNIVIGTMWISQSDFPQVCGNFKYTVDGKSEYQDDLTEVEESIVNIKEVLFSELENNKILAGNELYMVNGEELPVYSSSMLIRDTEGLKPAISYNKGDDTMAPRTEFFNGDILLDPAKVGSTVKLLAADKYNTYSYLMKSTKINKVQPTAKAHQTVKILCIGDDLINDKTAYYVSKKLASYDVIPNMLGTMNNSSVRGEGRKGWFYSTFVGASGRGYEEGAITPQTSQATSSILMNPFVRVANADDKANNPNDCYRASGSYMEKSYYTDTDKTGAFYIFDFAKYMETQGIETPDVVVVAVKPELTNVYTENVVSTNIMYMRQLVNGIRKALPNAYIALVPQYGISTMYPEVWEATSSMVEETVKYVDSLSDTRIKVVSSWLHMSREFGTDEFSKSAVNSQLYNKAETPLNNKLTETAKIEFANSIASFIMNI